MGIFSLTTIAQFWSYANEIYIRADGDRLFPLIAVGSAAGAPLGAAIAEELFGMDVNPFAMMEIAAGILLLHLGLYRVVSRRVAASGTAPAAQEPIKAGNGFALVLKSRYLGLIALLLVLLNIVNTVGEYILGQAVVAHGRRPARGRAPASTRKPSSARSTATTSSGRTWRPSCSRPSSCRASSSAFGMRGVLLALPLVALGAYGAGRRRSGAHGACST